MLAGASAEEHHASAAPHPRKRVLPIRQLAGALDNEVGTIAAVERATAACGIAGAHIDDAIGPESRAAHLRRFAPRPAITTSRTPRSLERQQVEGSKRAGTDDQHALDGCGRAISCACTTQDSGSSSAASSNERVRECETRFVHECARDQQVVGVSAPATFSPSPARRDFPARARNKNRFHTARSARPSTRRQLGSCRRPRLLRPRRRRIHDRTASGIGHIGWPRRNAFKSVPQLERALDLDQYFARAPDAAASKSRNIQPARLHQQSLARAARMRIDRMAWMATLSTLARRSSHVCAPPRSSRCCAAVRRDGRKPASAARAFEIPGREPVARTRDSHQTGIGRLARAHRPCCVRLPNCSAEASTSSRSSTTWKARPSAFAYFGAIQVE